MAEPVPRSGRFGHLRRGALARRGAQHGGKPAGAGQLLLGADGVGLGLQFLRRQPIQQGGVGQIALGIGLEQVAVDVSPGGDIGMDADEQAQPVIRFDLRSGQGAPDGVGARTGLIEPDSFLRRMVVRHG